MCQKWICMICLIDMSGTMLDSMLEMVQQAEMPSFTLVKTINRPSYLKITNHLFGYTLQYTVNVMFAIARDTIIVCCQMLFKGVVAVVQ